MSKVSYNKSIQKQIFAGIGFFLCVCILGWLLYPPNGGVKLLGFSAGALLITVFAIFIIRTRCVQADCPECACDLFEVIEATNPKKLKFSYCPNCGGKIEI